MEEPSCKLQAFLFLLLLFEWFTDCSFSTSKLSKAAWWILERTGERFLPSILCSSVYFCLNFLIDAPHLQGCSPTDLNVGIKPRRFVLAENDPSLVRKSGLVETWSSRRELYLSMLILPVLKAQHTPSPRNPFFSFVTLHLKELLIVVISVYFTNAADGLVFSSAVCSTILSLRLWCERGSLSPAAGPLLDQGLLLFICRRKEKEEPPQFPEWTVLWAGQSFTLAQHQRDNGRTCRREWDRDGAGILTGAMAPTRSALVPCWKVPRSSPPAFQTLENNEPNTHLQHLWPSCLMAAAPFFGVRSHTQTCFCWTANNYHTQSEFRVTSRGDKVDFFPFELTTVDTTVKIMLTCTRLTFRPFGFKSNNKFSAAHQISNQESHSKDNISGLKHILAKNRSAQVTHNSIIFPPDLSVLHTDPFSFYSSIVSAPGHELAAHPGNI